MHGDDRLGDRRGGTRAHITVPNRASRSPDLEPTRTRTSGATTTTAARHHGFRLLSPLEAKASPSHSLHHRRYQQLRPLESHPPEVPPRPASHHPPADNLSSRRRPHAPQDLVQRARFCAHPPAAPLGPSRPPVHRASVHRVSVAGAVAACPSPEDRWRAGGVTSGVDARDETGLLARPYDMGVSPLLL